MEHDFWGPLQFLMWAPEPRDVNKKYKLTIFVAALNCMHTWSVARSDVIVDSFPFILIILKTVIIPRIAYK
jgi:hypothetical protein